MIIIGITGTLGSGKGTVVEYLKEKYGFKHYSFPDFIQQEVIRRGLPETRDSMRAVGNDLRATYGPGYIAEQLYRAAVGDGGNAVLESIRAVGEITTLRAQSQPVFILAVDADPKVRYDRITARKSFKDNISFEKFLADEASENIDTDPSEMNLNACMALADARVTNDSDIATLHTAIDKIIQPVL